MVQAKTGDTVRVHYTGKLEDGTVFDSSADRDPLEFTLGKNMVIPGFEKAVIGMSPGDSKTETVAAEQGYGPYWKEMVQAVPRNEFPKGIEPKVGQMMRIGTPDGKMFIVRIMEVTETDVTLDGNHPLAGKDLTFDIELLEIV